MIGYGTDYEPPPDWDIPADDRPQPLHTVSIEDFATVHEEGAAPLLGVATQVIIPEDGDVVIYGDGGAGKTTLAIDLAVHWAIGGDREWLPNTAGLGIPIPRPVTSLIIENEGPRPLFRRKLNRKLAAGWGDRIKGTGRLRVLDEPWAVFTLADEQHRRQLADEIRAHHIDAVFLGPIVCAGMETAGTLQDVREFLKLITDVRRLAGRRVAFILIHHENRAGKVSGAWEGAADTLFHVTGMGPGHTRLHIQKARWASDYHAQTVNLAWTEQGGGYYADDKPEVTDEDIAEQMVAVIAESPGTGWKHVEEAIPGIRSARRRAIRDGLLATGRLVNIGRQDGKDVWLTECPKGKPARLYLSDDPTIRQLRPDPDADGTQSASTRGEGGQLQLRPASRPKRDAVADAVTPDPIGDVSTPTPNGHLTLAQQRDIAFGRTEV